MAEFQAWPKIPRLFRDVVITEKLDGTNAAVVIERCDSFTIPNSSVIEIIPDADSETAYGICTAEFHVSAQSRKRMITPESDNAGFARWVKDNALSLVLVLGEGVHFGEWWGKGIQRNYGLDEKRFSLFNTSRWGHLEDYSPLSSLSVVPVLYEGPFNSGVIADVLDDLNMFGSVASEQFSKPEGIVIYHTSGNHLFKVTIEDDEVPKELV